MHSIAPIRTPATRDAIASVWRRRGVHLLTRVGHARTSNLFPPELYGDGGDDPRPLKVRMGDTTTQMARTYVDWLAERIDDADLYWVSKQFTGLAVEAGRDLADATIVPGDLPTPSGLLIYEASVHATDDLDGYEDPPGVYAIGWTEVTGGVWLTHYAHAQEVMPDVKVRLLRETSGLLLPTGPGGWVSYDTALLDGHDTAYAYGHGDEGYGSPYTERILRTLIATLALIRQPGVADNQPGPVDKGLAKKYAKAGHRYPAVRVINLRRRPVPEGRDAPEQGRTYHVRWIVKGHWRNQACGPGRTLRRRTYIAPYLKGCDDAPIKAPTPAVHTLK